MFVFKEHKIDANFNSVITADYLLQVVRHLVAFGHDVHVVTGAPEFVFTTDISSPNLYLRKAGYM